MSQFGESTLHCNKLFDPKNFILEPPVSVVDDHRKHTLSPATTTTSVLALKFDKGVVMTADTLGSYGSMARFRNCPRMVEVNKNCLIGSSGDYADFQYLKDIIEQKIIDEDCMDDGFNLKPKALHRWLTRILYNRRSKFDPLWNTYLIAGIQDGKPYLGAVDKLGLAFEDDYICTGLGMHLTQHLLWDALQKKPVLTCKEAKDVLIKCMEVLYYRDARAFEKFQVATITEDKVEISDVHKIEGDWNVAFCF
uniref:Proteasome subunit beta n=1 Tax=Clastoptera arizonana TaxID=38151 RepID=A0A1B6CU75_9HEMI